MATRVAPARYTTAWDARIPQIEPDHHPSSGRLRCSRGQAVSPPCFILGAAAVANASHPVLVRRARVPRYLSAQFTSCRCANSSSCSQKSWFATGFPLAFFPSDSSAQSFDGDRQFHPVIGRIRRAALPHVRQHRTARGRPNHQAPDFRGNFAQRLSRLHL
jgi:hypothetical protein